MSTVLLIMPPTIGAAIRFITLDPAPLPHRMGSRPAMIAVTVMSLGLTRSTAPSTTASYKSRSEGLFPAIARAFQA